MLTVSVTVSKIVKIYELDIHVEMDLSTRTTKNS